MAAQKHTKNFRQNFLAFLNVCYPKNHPIKALYYLDSSRPNGRLSQNPKQEALGNYFCLKMISRPAP